MASGTIKIATLLGGISLLSWGAYMYNLKEAGSKLSIEPRIGVDVSWNGLVITSRPLIKNPTGFSFEINHPFVRLYGSNAVEQKQSDGTTKLIYEKGSEIGSSNPENKKYTVPARGNLEVSKIAITIPWANVPKLISQIKSGSVTIFTEILTDVLLDRIFNLSIGISNTSKETVNTTKIIDLVKKILP